MQISSQAQADTALCADQVQGQIHAGIF